MGLGGDYINLINELWEIEEFNMWDPHEHAAIAYLLDKLKGTAKYDEVYRKLFELAKSRESNTFAWFVSQELVSAYETDERISNESMEGFKQWLDRQKSDYDAKVLGCYGCIDDYLLPKWFNALFDALMFLEEDKRKNMIIEYCVQDREMSDANALEAYNELLIHTDILNEFYFFLKNKRFKDFFPIMVEGITAKHLTSTTYLSPIGAFNFLIYLREKPQEALEALSNGLPRK
ncbi:MAG: hypothetical protein GX802_06115 [Clostridiales bacterium]|jgi:hypothetical protein|nr:hypothetical protein [Clostridiales bacterium]